MSQQPGDAYKWVKEGIGHYKAKRYKECIDACERAIQLDPNCKEAYYGKGLALAQHLRYEEALLAYQKASQLAPESAKIHAAMAELFYNESDYEKSGLNYKKAIQLDSQFATVYAEQSKKLLDEVIKLRINVSLDLALKTCRELLVFDPDNSFALAELGKIQAERGYAFYYNGRYKEAVELYLEALPYNPDNALLHFELASSLYIIGDYEKSALYYKRAIQLDSQWEIVYAGSLKSLLDNAFGLHASSRHDLDKYDLALSAFRDVLLFDPGNVNARTEIEVIQREVGALRSCPIHYTGKLLYTSRIANTASIRLCSGQSDEEVRVLLSKSLNDGDAQINSEYSIEYFSRSADGWRTYITFPSQKTGFTVEVLHIDTLIAYGHYWIRDGKISRLRECNMDLTIAYTQEGRSSERENDKRFGNSAIYVPDRKGGRNRRVRRGS